MVYLKLFSNVIIYKNDKLSANPPSSNLLETLGKSIQPGVACISVIIGDPSLVAYWIMRGLFVVTK